MFNHTSNVLKHASNVISHSRIVEHATNVEICKNKMLLF